MARPEAERFLMCAQMFEDGKEIARIGMPTGLSDQEQAAYIYKRIYGEAMPS